jgi:pimeloyl-ACP methyl ester carboxylesterase
MNRYTLMKCVRFAICWAIAIALPVWAEAPKPGIVIMHGKGGSPARHVSDLAARLERSGFLVANLEMPWSGKRSYDVSVAEAENEVLGALDRLRKEGATKLFVAGHSQGGVFALYFASRHPVDGIIAIAPGGSVESQVFREKLGPSVERARQLVAEGKGDEKARLEDYEGSKGTYTVLSAPAVYLTWFDPDGAMNASRSAQVVKPETPILWLVAKRDYPRLRQDNIRLFDQFPANPLSRRVEPASDHLGAPSASADEIVRWVGEVMLR